MDTNGISPCPGSMGPIASISWSLSRSTWALCEAYPTGISRAAIPFSAQSRSNSTAASREPDTTADTGPFTAATASWSPHLANSAGRLVTGTDTATIVPDPDSSTSALLRSATSRAPSERDSPPATTAAAISPWECPTTTSGRTPYDCHRDASDTMTANSAGWTTSTRVSSVASRITSSSDHSTYGSSASAHARMRSANTGDVASRSAAIPAHWPPWPEKTNTAPVVPPLPPPPRTTFDAGISWRSRSSPVSSSSRSLPSTTARCASTARPAASVKPTSAVASSGVFPRCVSRRFACARNAAGVRADNTHGTGPPCSWVLDSGTSPSGKCSTITCALVPLTPNEDTPARRARPVSGHGTASVSRRTSPAVQSTCGVGWSTCSVRGSMPCRIAITILITPATPAAAWV